MFNEFSQPFTGTCKEFMTKYVTDVNAKGESTVMYMQTTNFEKVNYLAVADNVTQRVSAHVVTVSIVDGTAHVTVADETANPKQTKGNTKLLGILSPTTNENAVAWRNACKATQQAVAAKRKANRVNAAAQRLDDGYRPKMTRAQQIRTSCAKYRFARECPNLLERIIEQDAIGAIHFVV